MWEEQEGVAPVQRKCAGEESPVSEGARIPLRLMKPERGHESAGKCHRKHTALCVFTHKVRVKRCGKSAPRKGEGLGKKRPCRILSCGKPIREQGQVEGNCGSFFLKSSSRMRVAPSPLTPSGRPLRVMTP